MRGGQLLKGVGVTPAGGGGGGYISQVIAENKTQ